MIGAGRMLAVVVALPVAGCGEELRPPAESTPTASPSAAIATSTPTPTRTATVVTCSASELSGELPAQDLPQEVADRRAAIAQAAVACHYDELDALASDDGFTFSYGAGADAANFWRSREDAGDDVLAKLVRLLALPFTRNEAGFYAWPSAYTEEPDARDWELLRGIYDRREIASFRRSGSYLGYRIGISPDGEWRFFVAGD